MTSALRVENASDTSNSSSYQASWVLAFSVPQLVGWGSLYYAFALLIAQIGVELHLTQLELASAFSLGLLVEGIMAYPVGKMIDQGKARWLMPFGSFMACLGLWLLSRVHQLLDLYLAWIILGSAMSMVLYNTSFAVVTHRFPTHFRQAIITLSLLGGLASTVFIPLVAWMVNKLGWRHAVEILALLQLLLCVPLHIGLLRNSAKQTIRQSVGVKSTNAELRRLLCSWPFLLVCAFIMLMTTVSAALPLHLVSMLRAFGLDETWAILVPASMGIFQVASRLLLYFFEKRFDVHVANRIIPMLIPLGVMMLMSSIIASQGALVFAFGFILLFGMGNGMLTIVKGTAMAQYVSREHVASLNGAMGLPLALARASAPLLLATLWSHQFGYVLGLSVLLIVAILGVMALKLAQRLSGLNIPQNTLIK
jgi:MFS family permease